MALATVNPISQYFELAGDPLDAGCLYFGLPNQDPESHPITVYWDAAATQPAAQPVRTVNGYPARAGTPAIVYASVNYSLRVRNRKRMQVFYGANSADFGNAASLNGRIDVIEGDITRLASPLLAADGGGMVGFDPALSYAAFTLALQANTEINVRAVGAKGDGTTNDTTAITRACTSGFAVYFPAGAYNLPTGLPSLRTGTRIQGDSGGVAQLLLGADLPGAMDALVSVIVTDPVTQQGGLVMRDIYLNGGGHFGHGVLTRNMRFPEFHNVTIQNFNGAGVLLDYAEEGTLSGLKVNVCGRTNGDPNESTATEFGQITFMRSVDAVNSSNFIRIMDSTVANGRCSGDFMIKSGNVSRIYLERIQSETGNAAIGLRDWFLGQGLGGIVWITECDAVNYRVALKDFQFIEAYVNDNRITNCDKFLVANDGTGTFTASGNTTDGSMEVTSISSLTLVGNRALGSLFLEFPNNVRISSNSSIEALILNNAGALRAVCINDNTITGDLRIGADAACPGASAFDNRVAGGAYYGPFVHAVNNLVTGGETITPDARVQALRGAAMTGSITYGTAAPTTGTWQWGSKVINTAPAAGGYEGFICIATGTPGTWKGVGPIQA